MKLSKVGSENFSRNMVLFAISINANTIGEIQELRPTSGSIMSYRTASSSLILSFPYRATGTRRTGRLISTTLGSTDNLTITSFNLGNGLTSFTW